MILELLLPSSSYKQRMTHKLLILGANGLAAFMDFGVGMLIVAALAWFFGVELAWYQLGVAGCLALIPDLDIVPLALSGRNTAGDHHQSPFHRPLLVIPTAAAVAYLFGGQFWALATALAVFWHYLHDTNFIDTTYGIAWLWPFSYEYWSLRGSFVPTPWLEHHTWLHRYWLKPTFVSLRELTIDALSIVIATSLTGLLVLDGRLLALVVIFTAVLIWFTHDRVCVA